MTMIKVYQSQVFNPFQNLAIENGLLKSVKPDEKFLFLYINEPSIVLGRFQNPWLECDINNILRDKVHLVRRQSGGGTVYHDRENVNFSFIQGTRDHQKDINNDILVNMLKELQIEAYASGRSDLLVNIDGPKKISGSAFKQKKDRSIHHGTMLINSKLDILNNYLTTKHSDMTAKGIKSVRSNVINLSEINSAIDKKKFIEKFFEEFCKMNNQNVNVHKLDKSNIDSEHLDMLMSWDWRFGETPRFECNRQLQDLELTLKAHKGVIEGLEFYSESITPGILKMVSDVLVSKKLKIEVLEETMLGLKNEFNEYKTDLIKLENILKELKIFI